MGLTKTPHVAVQMLIRKPVEFVFQAFVDPAITTRFWFTKSSGPLGPGAEVCWQWEMYNASADVRVVDFIPNERIAIEWDEPARTVEWQFEARDSSSTMVKIAERGFQGDDDTVLAQVVDSTGGFTNLLASLKAYAEHDVELNLVGDMHPQD